MSGVHLPQIRWTLSVSNYVHKTSNHPFDEMNQELCLIPPVFVQSNVAVKSYFFYIARSAHQIDELLHLCGTILSFIVSYLASQKFS